MQIDGRKLVWLCVSGAFAAAGIGFGSGILVGRQFPAHHLERLGDSRYLVEPSTGKVCDPFKDPNAPAKNPNAPAVDLKDIWGKDQATKPTSKDDSQTVESLDEYFKQFQLSPPSYPPPCGK